MVIGPDEPKDPRVRAALEVMRVVSVVVALLLLGWLVLDRRNGGFEYFLALGAFLAGLLGLPWLARLMRRD